MNVFDSLNRLFQLDGPTLQELQDIEDSKEDFVPREGHPVNHFRGFVPIGIHKKTIAAYVKAAQVQMRKMINEGSTKIYLHQVYEGVGAQTPAEKNSVLWAVNDFKREGYVKNIYDNDGKLVRATYDVVK